MNIINPVNLSFFKPNEINTVIWDWNGTLLDDVEVNLKVINEMLSRRNLPQLNLSTYKNLFCFPVQSFQNQIGFDFNVESMEDISLEYHATYKLYEEEIKLNSETYFVVDKLYKKGIEQYILSASQKDYLERTVNDFGLIEKFKAVYGVSDIYATGKIEIGKLLIQDYSLNPDRVLIVGDTLHDAKVAESLGVSHVLYAGGHNSYDLLDKESVVITSLKELVF